MQKIPARQLFESDRPRFDGFTGGHREADTTRKRFRVTQKDLALTSGTGLRFIVELEKGKETCGIGKVLTGLNTLGIKITLTPPAAKERSIDEPTRMERTFRFCIEAPKQ